MKIFSQASKVSKEDPMSHFDFARFESQAGDFIFIESRFKYSLLRTLDELKGKKVVYWYGEEPNRFMSNEPSFRGDEYDTDFYKILTVCPYTAKWLNAKQGSERRTVVFVPINEERLPPRAEKRYEVIYVGNVHSQEADRAIKTLSKFAYRFVGRSHDLDSPFIAKIKQRLGVAPKKTYITDREVSYKEKMRLLSESKIALVHGLLWASGSGLRAIWNTPDFEGNGAFALIPKRTWWRWIASFFSKKEYLVPQLKTRFTEAAASRALMLVRKDPFNIIENYYTPGKEFVYYEENNLEEKITEILANWEKYAPIVENAYQKTVAEYTTVRFFEKFLKNLT